MELQDNELMSITGGAVKYGVFAVVGGVIAFIIGIVDGYLRPLPCNK